MTDCILHIGFEKTGSTSVQATLSKNRPLLLRRGVLYPTSLGERSHVKAYVFASEGGADPLKSQGGLADVADIDGYRESIIASLSREMRDHDPHLLCVSNEHCSSRLLLTTEIERLRDLLNGLCARITVVAYLRAQGDSLRSAYSTYVKTGGKAPFRMPGPAEIANRYDYDTILGRWADVFGDDNLKMRLYDRDRLVNGDVVSDFLYLLDPDLNRDDVVMESRMNASLGSVGLEFLRRINRYLPYAIGDALNPVRGNLHDLVGEFAEDIAFEGEAEIIDALDDAMSAGNDRVRRRYFPDIEGPLFKRTHREAPPPPTIDQAEAAIRLMAHIWGAKQKQVLQLRARIESLKRRTERSPRPTG